jgi:hypothetical protein
MIHWRDEVFRVIGLLLMCMAMFSVAGGHWAVLQAIAWAQMLQDYSRNGPITEAIAKTFSGRSPCSMCTKISEEQQREGRTPAVVKFDKKAEVFLVQALDPLKNRQAKITRTLVRAQARSSSDSDAPPAPIPIFA